MSTFRSCKLVLLASLALGALAACSVDANDESLDGAEEMLTRVSEAEVAAAQDQDIGGFTFDRLTPTSTRLMRASHWWMGVQDQHDRFPRPRMCATNVSKVLFLGGIRAYDQEGVRNLIADIHVEGSVVAKMPQTKSGFLDKLDAVFGGHIPAGTVVAGMSVRSSAPGDQHVGFIGHTDPDGTVWIYHNNWYRPENEGGQRKPHMVSAQNLRRGFLRQWMATPWIRIRRDAAGRAIDVTSVLPAIDDMDPFNPGFQVTLAIPREIASELAGGTPSTCTVTAGDGFTHLREGSTSQVLASVAASTSVRIVATEERRSRVDLEGWVSSALTTCGTAPSCGPSVKIADPEPATLGDARGTNLRVARDPGSRLAAVVANDATVEVLEQSGSRLRVRLQGTVSANECK